MITYKVWFLHIYSAMCSSTFLDFRDCSDALLSLSAFSGVWIQRLNPLLPYFLETQAKARPSRFQQHSRTLQPTCTTNLKTAPDPQWWCMASRLMWVRQMVGWWLRRWKVTKVLAYWCWCFERFLTPQKRHLVGRGDQPAEGSYQACLCLPRPLARASKLDVWPFSQA